MTLERLYTGVVISDFASQIRPNCESSSLMIHRTFVSSANRFFRNLIFLDKLNQYWYYDSKIKTNATDCRVLCS